MRGSESGRQRSRQILMDSVGIEVRLPQAAFFCFPGGAILSERGPCSERRHGPMLLPLVVAWLFLMIVKPSAVNVPTV